MKKILFTISLLVVSICSFAYYDYWNGQLYKGGPRVNEMMSSMPYATETYVSLSKQYVSDGRFDATVSMQIGWHNFHRKLALNYYWADWIVTALNYDRKVYYASKNSETYIEIPELRLTNKSIDVSAISVRASDGIGLSSYSSQYNEYDFRDELHIQLENLTMGNEYKLKVEYNFTPVPYSEHDGYHYNPEETTRYVTTQTVIADKSATGSQLVFKIAKVNANSVINSDGSFNPYYNTGSGERYLIYDDPEAVISVKADTVNLPCSKTTVKGTSAVTKKGYGSFLASVGATSIPTNIEKITSSSGCGIMAGSCSRNCNGINSNTIEFLNDNTKHKNFLAGKKYDTTSSCYRRWTNVLLRSLDSNLTMYDENSVDDFTLNNKSDFRMSRNYHLRDIANVVINTKAKYGAGILLKIQHSAIYTTVLDVVKVPKYSSYLSLAYLCYGPSFDLDLAGGTDVVSNIVEFEVVSKVTLPNLTTAEKAARLTCVTDSLLKEGDFIHLQGKQILCGVYSPSLYMPEYMWEVSFDGDKWETITQSNFSNYIIDRYNVKYAVIMDSEKDLLLRSTILRNKEKALFRQKVVLRSFSSNELSSLYNYDGQDGRYYISISSSGYYTFIPTPILDNDNFAFSPLSFPDEQRLCDGDALVNSKISFRLRSSTNVSAAQIKMLEEISDYKIYELQDGVPSKLVSNSASYTMNWKGESVSYRCVISWCRDSIFRDVNIIKNPSEVMDVGNVSSNAVICSSDKDAKSVSILCPQGSIPVISISDTSKAVYEYSSRGIVEYVMPDTIETEFSTMSRTKIISYMKQHEWDYEKETGTSIDNTGLDELRAWCNVKKRNINQTTIETAAKEYEQSNSWASFSDGKSTALSNSRSDGRSDIFFIKKRNIATGCESDSIKIDVTYFEGIKNNTISFAKSSESAKSITYVVKDSSSPAIKGLVISGGYGEPASGNSNVYIYRYLYRESGGVWQPLASDIVISGDDAKNVSLSKGAFNVDRKTDLCRIAISRNGSDVTTQVSDTSNILTIDVIEPISIDDVILSGDGECAGTKVSIGVVGYDPSEEVRKQNRYVWKVDDDSLLLVKSGDMDKFCDIYNSTSDFNVTVFREDTALKIKTPEVKSPIKVSTVKPAFSVVTGGGVEERILDYPDETFTFQSGTRFELKNISEGAESYVWVLELQYYTGSEVEGLKSYLENPVCYLYNQGLNKIRLTAKNSLGCESTVTAENLYIQGSSLRSAGAMSHFEPGSDGMESVGIPLFNVYPTISSGESLKISYSAGGFSFALTNQVGALICSGDAEYHTQLPMDGVATGLYQLSLWPSDGSGIGMQVYKILRK